MSRPRCKARQSSSIRSPSPYDHKVRVSAPPHATRCSSHHLPCMCPNGGQLRTGPQPERVWPRTDSPKLETKTGRGLGESAVCLTEMGRLSYRAVRSLNVRRRARIDALPPPRPLPAPPPSPPTWLNSPLPEPTTA